MDLVEIARLNDEGMIVINGDREMPPKRTLEGGIGDFWDQTRLELASDYLTPGELRVYDCLNDYKD